MSEVLDRHTALEELGPGRYGCAVEEGPYWGVATPHGGFTMALTLAAMQRALGDPARQPRMFSQQFLGRIPPGDVEIEVTVERAGRAVTSLSARLFAAGGTASLATGLFSVDRQGPSFLDEPRPRVAAPDKPDQGMVGFSAPVQDRFTFHRRFGAGGTAVPVEDGGWVVPIDPGAWDHRQALVVSDIWVPAIVRHPERITSTPTLHHVVHFGPDVRGGKGTAFLVRHCLSSGASGLTEEDVALWADDGRLLLRARQLRTVMDLRSLPALQQGGGGASLPRGR